MSVQICISLFFKDVKDEILIKSEEISNFSNVVILINRRSLGYQRLLRRGGATIREALLLGEIQYIY